MKLIKQSPQLSSYSYHLLCAHALGFCVQNEDIKVCKQPYSLLTPHTCDASVEQQTRTNAPENMQGELMLIDNQDNAPGGVNGPSGLKHKLEDAEDSQ